MATGLNEEQWKAIDDLILRGWIINGLKAIRAATGAGVHAAIDIYHERYDLLRQTRPAEFNCEHEEYWKEFYS